MRILILILAAALSINSLAGGEKKLPLPSDQKPAPDDLLTTLEDELETERRFRHDFGVGAATENFENPSLDLRSEKTPHEIDEERGVFKAIFNSEAWEKDRPMGTGTSSDTMPPDGLED